MQTKNRARAIATYAMVSALVLSATGIPVKAVGQWQQTNGVWNYTNEGKVSTGWQEIDNNWYSFDETGKMQTGWVASAEHWYFLGGSGIMQNDAWVTDTDGSKFYIKGTGVMATDYVKDGFELTADGKAVPLADSKSVVLSDLSNLEGTTIEGNLYVDATLAKELLIKGVTVTGKLVLLGDNKTTTKLTITDSNINAISTQTRDSEIVLSGTTSVKSVVLQETTKVTPDASFKGQVDTIEVQSTTKGEVVVSVPAKEVSSRTFATVDIQAPVDKLDIKTNTTVNINADVKEVAINEFAAGTKVEVSKGNTVGKIDTEVKVEVSGSGSVDEVTGAGKDESIVTPKPEPDKPTTGGGSTGGGNTPDPTPKPTPEGHGISNEDELRSAFVDLSISEIYLKNEIEITSNTDVREEKNALTINLNEYKIDGNNRNAALRFFAGKTLVTNGTINALQGTYCTIIATNSAVVNVQNMNLNNVTGNGNSVKAFKGGIVNIRNTKSTSNLGGGMEATGGTINVYEGSKFTQTDYFDYNSSIGAASKGGTLNIYEGVEGTSANHGLYVFNSGGTINVKGGTFTAGKDVLRADNSITTNQSVINVDGGTFDGKIEIGTNSELNITAGTFKNTGKTIEDFKKYVNESSTVTVDNGVFVVTAGHGVSNEIELDAALNEATIDEIYLKDDVYLTKTLFVNRAITINGNDKILSKKFNLDFSTGDKSVVNVSASNVILKNLKVEGMGNDYLWDKVYGIIVDKVKDVTLQNVAVKGIDLGVLVMDSSVLLSGTTNVEKSNYGGILVNKSTESTESSNTKLTLAADATIINNDESFNSPLIWAKDTSLLEGFEKLSLQEREAKSDKSFKRFYLESMPEGTIYVDNGTEFADGLRETDYNIKLIAPTVSASVTEFKTRASTTPNSSTKSDYIIDHNVMIDLNNNSLELSGNFTTFITNKANVVFKNGNVSKTFVSNEGLPMFTVEGGNTIEFNNVVFKTDRDALYSKSGGTININGGSFTAETVLKSDDSDSEKTSTININGGTFNGKIDIHETATLNITAGTFTNTGIETLEEFNKYVDSGSTATGDNGNYIVTVGEQTPTEPEEPVNPPVENTEPTSSEEKDVEEIITE